MIPISDSVRTRSTPYVNLAIIVVNLLVFLYEVYLSQDVVRGNVTELDLFIYEWGNVPACTFEELGRNASLSADGRAICADQEQPLLTMVTAMFIHGGWLHIGGNMLFLWIFGDNIEDALGHLRYLLFYLVCGIAAALAHGLLNIDSVQPAVGASGAIAGVMGAYIVLFPRAMVHVIIGFIFIPLPLPAFVLIGFWIVIQIFYGWASLGWTRRPGASRISRTSAGSWRGRRWYTCLFWDDDGPSFGGGGRRMCGEGGRQVSGVRGQGLSGSCGIDETRGWDGRWEFRENQPREVFRHAASHITRHAGPASPEGRDREGPGATRPAARASYV